MIKRLALSAFLASVLLIAAAYGSAFLPGEPPGWAAWALAMGTCVALVSMMAVGASRGGRIGRRLGAAFGLVLAITAGGFAVLLALPAADPADPTLILGLPPRAAVLLYGIGLLPFFVVPLAYAWTFDDFTLSDADLARVREAARGFSESAGVAGDTTDVGQRGDVGAGSRASAEGAGDSIVPVEAGSGAGARRPR